MHTLQLYRIQLQLAVQYLSGESSGFKFSRDLADRHARNAELTAGLNFDASMQLEDRIKWMQAFN